MGKQKHEEQSQFPAVVSLPPPGNAVPPTPNGGINICSLKGSSHCKCSWRLNAILITLVYFSGRVTFACAHPRRGDEAPACQLGPASRRPALVSPCERGSLNQKLCVVADSVVFMGETFEPELGEAEMVLRQNLFVPRQDDSCPQGTGRGAEQRLLRFGGTRQTQWPLAVNPAWDSLPQGKLGVLVLFSSTSIQAQACLRQGGPGGGFLHQA